MAIETDLRSTITERAKQLALFIKEIRDNASRIISVIDGNTAGQGFTGEYVLMMKRKVDAQRGAITSWPFGSLTDSNVRGEVARMWPKGYDPADATRGYTDSAEVTTELQAINTTFETLQTELETLLTSALSGATTLEDAANATFSAPEISAVRTAAASVEADVNGPYS